MSCYVFVDVLSNFSVIDCLQFVFNMRRVLFLLTKVVSMNPYGEENPDVIWGQIADRMWETLLAEAPEVKIPMPMIRTLKDKVKGLIDQFTKEDWRNLKK